jgi:hypothetical protein
MAVNIKMFFWGVTACILVGTYPEHQQDFSQGGAHYVYAGWQDFLMIRAGQDRNIVVILLRSLINP